MDELFPHVHPTCHWATSRDHQAAAALPTPQLCTLLSSPEPGEQEVSSHPSAFCCWGIPLSKDFLRKSALQASGGMTPSSTAKGFQWTLRILWLHLAVISPGFKICRVVFPQQFGLFQIFFSWPITHTITFSVVSQDNFYVVDLTDCSTPPSFCLSFKAREPFLHFRFRDNKQNAIDCSVQAGLTTLHLPAVHLQGPGYPHCISSGRQELQESFHGVNQTAYPALLPPVEYYFTGSVTGNSTITARLMMFRNGAELENTRGRGWWTAHSMGKL